MVAAQPQVFQFQYGSIKSLHEYIHFQSYKMFQFQYGSIKS